MFKSGRGGSRRGGGRQIGSGDWGEETKVLRVPQSLTKEKLERLILLEQELKDLAQSWRSEWAGSVRGAVASRLAAELEDLIRG